jgi:predicted Zn-dependent protease
MASVIITMMSRTSALRSILFVGLLILAALFIVRERLPAQDPNVLFQQAVQAGNRKDYDTAISIFSHLILNRPSAESLWYARGMSYELKGDRAGRSGSEAYYAKAEADFTQAVSLKPDFQDALMSLGIVCDERGKHDVAIDSFTKLIHLAPTHPGVFHNRALAYWAKGKYPKAADDLTEAIQSDADEPDDYNLLGWLRAACPEADLRDGKKAVEYATKACELTSWKNSGYVDTLAAACAETGDFDRAIQWERMSLAAPDLGDRDKAERQACMALYQTHKPYHWDN